MQPEQYPERRRHPRVKARFIVTYKVNEPLRVTVHIDKREISALMADLSEGGMAVITSYAINIGTLLAMSFTLINTEAAPGDERIRTMDIRGEVRYQAPVSAKEHRLGIFFTNISEADKSTIKKFVDAMHKYPHEHA